jgi:ankyrin repeat protein
VNGAVLPFNKVHTAMAKSMLENISDGQTDLVLDFVSLGNSAKTLNDEGVALIQLCAYYGDVTAIKFLIRNGETVSTLGDNLDLNGAVFHGHPRLCQFLIEQGADVNRAMVETGETPLHAALCTSDRRNHDPVVKILLANGANPNCATEASVATEAFMRDIRTRAETPLHRAAAFGTEETIQMLLDAGAHKDAKDMNGDSPLTWASWHLRPRSILRLLCYGDYRVR